ncbi:MAG: ABC transporter ATP-binding protein [Streptococcaceae bacterium]|jgi:ABC-2 type transport system ATP-binding protein|nr:ABC transporter ATP-binding protein [Streptococcaceae bacterium]
MLEIKNLTIKTRQPILKNYSGNFEMGKLYGLVATNGAGKTTFFRAIMGLIKYKGKIRFDGQDIQNEKQNFFYFETSAWLDVNLSGMDYLTFVRREWNSNADISVVVSYWEMEDYIYLPIKKYSLGMKQKLIIAMYQVSQARFMLMDEITNGLDTPSRALLFSALKDMLKQGAGILLSSHYNEDILPICDFLMTLENQEMRVEKL